MTKATDMECHGCKVSMFCSRKDKSTGQPCETSLRAVAVAFVIPLCCILLVLFAAQGRMADGCTALCVVLVLAAYFLIIRLLNIDFGKWSNRK